VTQTLIRKHPLARFTNFSAKLIAVIAHAPFVAGATPQLLELQRTAPLRLHAQATVLKLTRKIELVKQKSRH
jgi:predicted component of type VI protein secretion system